MTDQTSSTRVERRSTLSLPTASGAPTQPRAGRTTTRDSQVGAADSRDETVSAPHDLRAADGLPIPATDRHTGASSIVATPQDDDRHDDTDLTPDDDDPFPADKDDEGDAWAAASRPGHRVMDRGAIIKAMLASGYDGGSYDHLSSGEEQRARTLVRYRDMNLVRPHLVGSPAMLARLDALEVAQPNFAAVTELVRRAAQLSQVAGAPLRVPPLVLLGSPGVGKSRYARAIATALDTSCDLVVGTTLPDVGSLTGYPPVWRGAGPGRLAKCLVAARTSGPLLFVDEAEKIVDYEAMACPLDRLLTILEPITAADFMDENLQVPMRAQHMLLVFAVNSLAGLSAPFLDRVVVVRVPDLAPAQREAVLQAMLAEVAERLGLAVRLAGPEALAPLHSLGLRRCRLAFELAVADAVANDRRFLLTADLARAVALLAGPDERAQPVGFIRHGSARD